MNKLNRSWMAVVAAALLLGTLVGVVWARPHDRPQAQDITRKVTLTPAAFVPTSAGQDYFSESNYVQCDSPVCTLIAQVVFPCLPAVDVKRVKLHVIDNADPGRAIIDLQRAHPSTGQVLTGQYVVESPSGLSSGFKTYSSPLWNVRVWPSQGAVVALTIQGPGIWVYGVTVEYQRNI